METGWQMTAFSGGFLKFTAHEICAGIMAEAVWRCDVD